MNKAQTKKDFAYYFCRMPANWNRNFAAGVFTAGLLGLGRDWNPHARTLWIMLAVAGGFYVLNWLLGYMRACADGEYEDGRMAQTLTKGAVYAIHLALAFGVGQMLGCLWDMFPGNGAEAPVKVGTLPLTCLPLLFYCFVIALREATQIAQHSEALGVPLPTWLRRLIQHISDRVDDGTDDIGGDPDD